ncbi:MAG: nucleotide exchange factor GrpE [Bdellovibrionota bacterium]
MIEEINNSAENYTKKNPNSVNESARQSASNAEPTQDASGEIEGESEISKKSNGDKSDVNADYSSENDEKCGNELDELKALAAENYDRFMRVSADYDNLRRRSEKERKDLLRYGNENLFKELLPVFDSFQKAIPNPELQEEADTQAAGDSDDFIKGMILILKQLSDVMKRNGLEEIESIGAKFDPNYHQAIQRIESAEVEVETVKDEFVKGYLLHDRLIRPAMVSVLVPTPEKEGSN